MASHRNRRFSSFCHAKTNERREDNNRRSIVKIQKRELKGNVEKLYKISIREQVHLSTFLNIGSVLKNQSIYHFLELFFFLNNL